MITNSFTKILGTAALACGLIFVSTPIHAISAGGDAAIVPAPASVLPGAFEANNTANSFYEGRVTLPGALSVDVISPGVGVGGIFTRTVTDPGAIASGTVVDSYLIHHDPVGTAFNSANGTYIFDSAILGVIFLDANLDLSDGILGAAGTLYPTGTAGRGFDNFDDIVWLASMPNILDFSSFASVGIDQIRVITATPEPSTYALLGSTLMLGFLVKRRNAKMAA